MATRTITHFKVGAPLFNDITQVLFNLPAHTSRELLNRIEGSKECEPIFKIEIEKPPPGGRKKPTRKKKASKKVANRKRRS